MILDILFAAVGLIVWAGAIVTALLMGLKLGRREGFTQGYRNGRHDGEHGIPRVAVRPVRGDGK